MATEKNKRAEQLHRIASLYLSGKHQQEIADAIGVTQQAISKSLKVIRKEWMKNAVIDFDERVASELAKIDELERSYWEGWERSIKNAEIVTQKSRTGSGEEKGQEREVTLTRKGQSGDPRFLDGVARCIEQRCKLLGVNAPDRMNIDMTVKGYKQVSPDDWD